MKDLKTRQTLLLRIRNSEDEGAWGEFVELYSPVIFGFCRKRGLQEADAADVLQEVMKNVSQYIGKFDYNPEKGTFRSWLYTITRNEMNRFFRKRQRQPQGTGRTTIMRMVEDQPDPEAEADWDREYRRQLFHWAANRVKGEFTEQTWSAFWKTAVDQEKAGDVAEGLGMTVGAAYIAKSRVLARIGETIDSIAGEWDLPAQFA